jgi:hypothetical protein
MTIYHVYALVTVFVVLASVWHQMAVRMKREAEQWR